MATTAAAIDQAANPKPVESSLWWDPFVDLFDQLQNPPQPSSTLTTHHRWFLETLTMFKPSNPASKSALDSNQLKLGSHHLTMDSNSKDLALRISRVAGLDEVQSYILVRQFVDRDGGDNSADLGNCLHLVLLHYYIERQCLLKCVRQIILWRTEDSVDEEASKLVSDGLDGKLWEILRGLLVSKPLEDMEPDIASLWAEEKLIEGNLILDILFIAYYENLCEFNAEKWKNLCSIFKEMLSKSGMVISTEARNSLYNSRVKLLLILVETLDLGGLLKMVHDEVPFGKGPCVFTLSGIQEMDAAISSLGAVEAEEASPLILAWAVFVCLISSLPERQEALMDIDHIGYVRQAFKAQPLISILEILGSDVLKDFDAPVAGYRSVIRTFVSAFIAAYEVTQQLDDDTNRLILDIICKIYRGEESLCIQFWDRDSFIDAPIRSLLNTLEAEFPHRVTEFVCMLSALCEGSWPAECVYNYLDRQVGISSLFQVSGNLPAENISPTIETPQALHVPGVENLLIPSRTHGRVLKFMDMSTILVRWEYRQSGIFVLLLRLARQFYLNDYEETHCILDLLGRLVSFSKAVCSSLLDFDSSLSVQTARGNGNVEKNLRVDVAEMICTLVRSVSPNIRSVSVMSMSLSILAKMLKCSPSHVSGVVLKKNIFDMALKTNNFDMHSNESDMWMLSSGLARMLSIDCEQTGDCCSLTLSVLDFTQQLVETGAEDEISMALVVFSLQYILVNHELWKYKDKCVRWKVTLKVLELVKICINSIPISQKMGSVIRDILLCDSSVHNTLCRIMCITSQTLEKLHVSRLYEIEEIEGLQMAICRVLDIVYTMLTSFSEESFRQTVFHQTMVSSTTKPVPVVTALISLMSYFSDPALQVAAAKVLSMLCIIAENVQPYMFANAALVSDDKQITVLRYSIYNILSEQSSKNEDLLSATLNLLSSAARHQPAFLISVMSSEDNLDASSSVVKGIEHQPVEDSQQPLKFKNINVVDALLHYIKKSKDLIESNPKMLLNVLFLLKGLWQGTIQYVQILEQLKASELFWKSLSTMLEVAANRGPDEVTTNDSFSHAYEYQCCSAVLEIMTYDLFLENKLTECESTVKQTSEKSKAASRTDVQSILLAWCESSFMENLITSYASCQYDSQILIRATTTLNMFLAHAMGKAIIGDSGSLSLSLLGKILDVSKKLCDLPAFSELLAQYSRCGYNGGKEPKSLILNDLYYHIQGEIEGRKMNSAPFKELAQFMLQLKVFRAENKYVNNLLDYPIDTYMFDLVRSQNDLALEYWEHSNWRNSKVIAEKMMLYMRDANMMSFLSCSKLGALKALTRILAVHGGNLVQTNTTSVGRGISETFISSCIEHVCRCLQKTVQSLATTMGPSVDIINFLREQAGLLLCLMRLLCRKLSEKTNRQLSVHVCTLVLKTASSSLRLMSSIISSMAGLEDIMKLFLLVLLLSFEFCCSSSSIQEKEDTESFEGSAEISLQSLGLLPVLCSCTEIGACCDLSLATMDLILNGFLTSSTWLPILQKHLQLQLVIQKLRERDSFPSISIVLKFLLTLARVRGGAKMLQTGNLFASLKILINSLSDQKLDTEVLEERGFTTSTSKVEKHHHIWGLGLTVVTAMIYSLGNSSSCASFMDSVVSYFFSEKPYMIFYYIDLPDLPSEDHGKKKARTQTTCVSLTSMKEIEHTLMLICVLTKYRKSWLKSMKEINSQLRERSIHLLAFISRGAQRIADFSTRTRPLLCPPTLKEEIELNRISSVLNCRHGWFTLLPSGHSVSSTTLVPLNKNHPTPNTDLVSPTKFSDVVAVQVYRIALLLLKFLSLQAKEAANRAEEMGFINLAHFPELPMPEILHGLQDQAIAIVTELCEMNRSKEVSPEIQNVCRLLLQIMEKSLYLEFCVAQSYGIRPVLGRVEDFSKEFKMLVQVAEQHTFLKAQLKSLQQIISFVYPGLFQMEGFLQ